MDHVSRIDLNLLVVLEAIHGQQASESRVGRGSMKKWSRRDLNPRAAANI